MVAASPFTVLTAHDGSTFSEEATIRGVAAVVGRGARVVGGSAGDDLAHMKPAVFCNGKALRGEFVAAVVGTSLKNGTGMANAFTAVTSKGAFVTSSEGRNIKTLNNRPAADVYAELVGATSREAASNHFKDHPFGLLDATSGYWQVRSPGAIDPKTGAMSFFSAVPQGIGLTLLTATKESRVESVKKAVERAWEDAGRPKRIAAVVLFNCILCHYHAAALGCSKDEVNAVQKHLASLTGADCKDVAVTGFSTYGETGSTSTGTLGHHNQTVTVWLLADELIHESGEPELI
jgi:hypothetical protein